MKKTALILLLMAVVITAAHMERVSAQPVQKVRLAMTYIPNVQFAPWYVAKEKGFFKKEGLDIEFDYRMDIDALQLVAQGDLDFAVAGGDQVITARAQGIPVKYIASLYAKFPPTVISLQDKGIRGPGDLKGKTIGLPLYGTSLLAIRAIMAQAGLKDTDLRLVDIGYTQIPSLTEGKVDAVVGFANNEPIQLRDKGYKINQINAWDYFKLVGHGLVTGDRQIARSPQMVKAMVRATVAGIRYAAAHPDEAFQISLKYIPTLTKEQWQVQQKILQESINLWQNDYTRKNGWGKSDPAAWEAAQAFMVKEKLAVAASPVKDLMTNEYVGK